MCHARGPHIFLKRFFKRKKRFSRGFIKLKFKEKAFPQKKFLI